MILYRYDDSNLLPAAPAEKSSRSISRFMTSGKKSARPGTAPSTAAGVVPFGSGSKDDTHTHSGSVRDPALLRKRHISTSGPISPPLPTGSNITSAEAGQNEVAEVGENGEVQFRPGQSVLDQIGEPDHAGWLRKKGERYNSWKLRYLVLRGSHLYYLRSNSRTVGAAATIKNRCLIIFANRKQRSRDTFQCTATRWLLMKI